MTHSPQRAMLFAAGLGTRLGPHTLHRPKALVEVGGRTLLEINLRRLAQAGFGEVVVNVHHFADQVEAFLAGFRLPGLQVYVSDERDLLRDTGGGLLHAKTWLDTGPFLVHNVDILSDLDLAAFFTAHLTQPCLATLAVRKRPSSRQLLFDPTGQLVGWMNQKTGEKKYCRLSEKVSPLAFSGIYALDPAIFTYMNPSQPVFSIIDTLLAAAADQPVCAYRHDASRWLDVGKPDTLDQAEKMWA